jgi:hypothetical protein
MMVELTYELILSTIQTIALVVGIVYYLTIMRNAQRNQELARKAQELAVETRQAQLFMQIFSKFSEENFIRNFFEIQDWQWEDTDDYIEKYEEPNEPHTKWATLANYYEGVGVLVKRGLIDVSLVDDLMSGSTMRFWEKFEDFIMETRIRYNWPQRGEYIEYLYNQVKTVVKEQHPELAP